MKTPTEIRRSIIRGMALVSARPHTTFLTYYAPNSNAHTAPRPRTGQLIANCFARARYFGIIFPEKRL